MMNGWQKQDLLKRRFTLPNELFSLKLNSAEISIYTYLLYIENRKTHQCWPSYKTIGKAVKLSNKTVKKYVAELVDKGLISTENTTVTNKDGQKQNGCLRYTIRPIQLALDQFYEQQLARMDVATERQRVAKALALRCDKYGSA